MRVTRLEGPFMFGGRREVWDRTGGCPGGASRRPSGPQRYAAPQESDTLGTFQDSSLMGQERTHAWPTNSRLFDHFVGDQKHVARYVEAYRPGGLEVDDE